MKRAIFNITPKIDYSNCYRTTKYIMNFYFDTETLISQCNSSYYHRNDKIPRLKETLQQATKKFEDKFYIHDIDIAIYTDVDNKQYLNVFVIVYVKMCAQKKFVVDLLNTIAFHVEYYEHCLANYIAKHKHVDLPYPNPKEVETQYTYKQSDYEVKYNEWLEKEKNKPKPGDQLSLNLEQLKKAQCIDDYLGKQIPNLKQLKDTEINL